MTNSLGSDEINEMKADIKETKKEIEEIKFSLEEVRGTQSEVVKWIEKYFRDDYPFPTDIERAI